jgi:hypothetical protein
MKTARPGIVAVSWATLLSDSLTAKRALANGRGWLNRKLTLPVLGRQPAKSTGERQGH